MEKKFLVFDVSASELVATFSTATIFTVVDQFCEGTVVQIGTVLRPICHVVCQRVL